MDEKLIYTDNCLCKLEQQIAEKTNTLVVKRLSQETWNVNDTMRIITYPSLVLAVINSLDSISLMEIALLHFMCKPILVTSKTITHYPAVLKTVDYVDVHCSLIDDSSVFMSWYIAWKDKKWN